MNPKTLARFNACVAAVPEGYSVRETGASRHEQRYYFVKDEAGRIVFESPNIGKLEGFLARMNAGITPEKRPCVPRCQHDPLREDKPHTLRLESHPIQGVRLRCRVCNRAAALYKRSGIIDPIGEVEPPEEAGNG